MIGKTHKWISNYLSNRKQCTVANDIVSKEKLITCGVPQGSVCGPLLFLLYINDVTSSLTNCKVSLYAYEIVIYMSHTNKQTALQLLQQDLVSLNMWCKRNKLTINCKKTQYCIFGMKSTINQIKNVDTIISLNGNVLDRVCSYKYLGFWKNVKTLFSK